jgi:DNA-binding response OmpR family regulator
MPDRHAILVVEDDDTLRTVIGEVLRDEGHHVDLASDGEQALDVLRVSDPDLIILDVMMPRMDAFRFRELQRARGPGRAAVLVVSAVRDVQSAAATLEAQAFLGKPFQLTALLAEVDRLLAGRSGATPGSAD